MRTLRDNKASPHPSDALMYSRARILAVCASVVAFLCLPVQAQYGGGRGTEEDPYQIWTAEQMNQIGLHEEDWRSQFILMAHIDLGEYTGDQFNIIGTNDSHCFGGTFDGNGLMISNFTYRCEQEFTKDIGLFRYVSGSNARITNLGIIDPSICAPDGRNVGALVGRIASGRIANCYVDGGGIIGASEVGGLIGNSLRAVISDCWSRTSVSGHGAVGGLLGIGQRSSGLWKHTQLISCYSACEVSGVERIGGLVGIFFVSDIQNCYSISNVSGQDSIGGFVGVKGGSINNSYSAGSVTGDIAAGGFIGLMASQRLPANCFWDVEASGLTNMCGSKEDGGADCNDAYGKTTAQMKQQATFTDWDFAEVWDIGENQTYPFLRFGSPGDFNRDNIVNWVDLSILASHWLEQEQ